MDSTYKVASPETMSDAQLAQLGSDANCSNAQECLEILTKRKDERAKQAESDRMRSENVRTARAELQGGPFGPPNEVSAVSADAHFIATSARADAGRIIKHLWIIFVLLPVVLGILFAILK